MANQIMVAQTNILVEGTGKTVEWKKVYCSDVSDSGDITSYTIDTTTYYWRLAGDGGADDPGTAIVVECEEGSQSSIDSGFYYYYGAIETSYTYTLYVNTVAQLGLNGVMLFSMDLMPKIALNDTHTNGDGSDHADVESNTSHRGVNSGVHGVTGNVVGHTDTQTLTGKTLTGNTMANVKPDGTEILTFPVATDTIVGKTTTDTMTNKTLTTPTITSAKINELYNSAGTYKLAFPTITTNDTIAQDGDLTTKEALVEELASGTTDSISVLRYIFSNLMNSEKFATMMSYAGFILTGIIAPNTAPTKIGQIYINTNTSPPDVYISTGTSASTDWDEVTMV